MNLNEYEKVIVEGVAKLINKETNIEGKLFLTHDRLMFISPVPIHSIEYSVDEINDVCINKTCGIFKKGFTISVDGKEERFKVKYPADWKKIIEKQQELNQDL